MNKVEVDIVIGILQSVLLLAEKIHPQLENNPTIIAINKTISTLQALGL
jgi:hypothetical protein